MSELFVSIEQDDCTACGLCSEIQPKHFYSGVWELAYVKDADGPVPDVPPYVGLSGKVAVGAGLEATVIEAAEECPAECIYVDTSI